MKKVILSVAIFATSIGFASASNLKTPSAKNVKKPSVALHCKKTVTTNVGGVTTTTTTECWFCNCNQL